jgi:hypothetical protein|tara:strand:+ start:2778 stop:3161 length:384 start_codon:yes stop_codon:yes gene_type:complete
MVRLPLGLLENGTVNTPAVTAISQSGVTGGSSTCLTTGAPILSNRYGYSVALVQNVGSNNILLTVGGTTASTTAYHVKLSPMSQVDMSDAKYEYVTACTDDSSNGSAVLFTVQTNDSSHTPGTAYGT